MTQSQNNTDQPEQERSMMPLLQTSAHYPETSKQDDQSSSNRSFGTLSASPIQEHTDSAKTPLSAMTHGTNADQSSTPPSNDQRSRKHATPPSHDQELTAIAALSIIITAMLTMTLALWKQGLSSIDNPILSKTRIDQATTRQVQHTMQHTECSRCGHWAQEGLPYKSPSKNATYSPSKTPAFPPMPSTPNNTPITSPCLLPPTIPLLQLRSKDSGSKEKSTTTPGKATMSSIHGGATMTAVTPGTVARQWVATKIMLQTKTITATLGILAQRWEAATVVLPTTPITRHKPPITMLTTKTTSNALGHMSPHHGTSPLDKNTTSSTTSSPTLSANDFPITPHSECLGNASPSTTLHTSASTYAWMAPHNDSQEKSRLLTSITQTWRNSSTTWNGTYV